MTKKVEIACEGRELLPLAYLKPLQGNLKTLSAESYAKLRSEIITDGFSFPIAVWHDKSKDEFYVLDGHQRVAALNKMKDEGFSIPQIPVIFVSAKNLDHAKKKLLAAASQYGQFDSKGIADFLQTFDFDMDEISSQISIPSIDDILLTLDDVHDVTKVSEHYRKNPGQDFQEVEMPDLKNTDEPELKQMTFILHKDQVETIQRAIKLVKNSADFDTSKNENSNGNSLAAIAEFFLSEHGDG